MKISEVKIRYGVISVKGASFGDWLLRLLSKRLGVPCPRLVRDSKSNKDFFRTPNQINLSSMLYVSTMQKFVAVCIHEFAHYMHFMENPKKYHKLRKPHGEAFYKWLRIVAKAAFRNQDGDALYPWGFEYKSLQNRAKKDGLYETKAK